MSEVVIKTDEKKEEPDKVDREDIKETLKKADDYEKEKAEVEKLEALFLRKQEVKAKLAMDGRALAGEQEETQEDKDEKEAADLIGQYR